jgi:hypothetical protein
MMPCRLAKEHGRGLQNLHLQRLELTGCESIVAQAVQRFLFYLKVSHVLLRYFEPGLHGIFELATSVQWQC